jgi:hypothetical protein
MVSESWRNPFVAPSVSGTQLRNPCWIHAETVCRGQKHGQLNMKTPFSCREHEVEYFAHAWISLVAPRISFVCFYILYHSSLVTTACQNHEHTILCRRSTKRTTVRVGRSP